MKFLAKAIFIFFICNQAIFAEWKTEGWKEGEHFWWTSILSSKACNVRINAYQIEGIRNDVVKIINIDKETSFYQELEELTGYISIESAENSIKNLVKRCKLKKRYENNSK